MKEEIKKIIEKAITKLQAEKVFVNFDLPEILV